jgi:hypothetical protein
MSMRRRHFLAGTAALGGAIGSSSVAPLLAQQGPVFMDYTQHQLDQAYDQAVWAPQLVELQAQDDAMSAAVRKATPPRTERYGKREAEQVDIFTPANGSSIRDSRRRFRRPPSSGAAPPTSRRASTTSRRRGGCPT